MRRFGLSEHAAHAVRQALTSPSGAPGTIRGLSWVFFILGGLAAAAAIQELYERVFEVEGRGFRDTPRRVAWLVVALDFSLLASLVQSWLHDAGGIVLVAVVALVGAND